MRAIALVSGGLDSTVAAWAASRDNQVALGLTCDYGQRSAVREVRAAKAICERIGCEHGVVDLRWLGSLGQSALTDAALALPEVDLAGLDDAEAGLETSRAVWVPNRNGVFINVAAAFCEAYNCQAIVVGFNVEEAAFFSDNSAAFMEATNEALSFSTRSGVSVMSPTAALNKKEIVALGQRLGAPIDLVWSCYEGGETHCMKCESCGRLKRALEECDLWEEWAGNDRRRQ